MKKQLLTLFAVAAALTTQAQTIANDSVSTGAAYINNGWYSLDNGIQKTDSASNWDLAVASSLTQSSMAAAIHFNPKMGKLYEIDSAATAFANVFDTSGLASWTPLYNADSNWSYGAFNRAKNLYGAFDYGWGTYDMATHNLNANRIFLVKYTTGQVKKLAITALSVAGKYVIHQANLDNSANFTDTIATAAYSTKNFFYVSLLQHAVKDREPAAATWDMLFTQYVSSTEAYSGSYTQTVTGVLTNAGVQVAQHQTASSAAAAAYVSYATDTFKSKNNIIGWDWKAAPGPSSPSYTYNDSVVYFVKKANGDIWKLRMTNFGWSATGVYYFSKQKLVATSVKDAASKVVATVALSPNPSNGQDVTLVYSFDQQVEAANVIVTDIAGRTVYNQAVTSAAGLQQHAIHTSNLKAGMYIVNLVTEKGATSQKLIVQ